MRNETGQEHDDSKVAGQRLEPSVIIAGAVYFAALLALIFRLMN